MSLLVIGPEARWRIGNLRKFAEGREHWFRPGVDDWTPGDMPEYVATVSDYRVVFTWSIGGSDVVYRHLSVSSPRPETHLPIPYTCWSLATLFGFTGFDPDNPGRDVEHVPDGWQARIDKDAPIANIAVIQHIEGVSP